MSVCNDALFWSGQMSAKNFRSSPGRWLSIGTQYLKISPSVVVIVNTRESKPYRMQSGSQSPFSTLASNELLQNPKFLYTARLNSARVVKHVARMIGEYEFVIDRVLASLALCSEATKRSTIVTNIHGRVKCNLVGSETRLSETKRLGHVPPHLLGK